MLKFIFKRVNYVLMWPFVLRHKRMLKSRGGSKKEDFLGGFEGDDRIQIVASKVWDRMVSESPLLNREFKPDRFDLLGEDYGIENEDLRDLICDLSKDLSIKGISWRALEIDEIHSVNDLIDFLFEARNNK